MDKFGARARIVRTCPPRRSDGKGGGSDRVDVRDMSMSVHWPGNDHSVRLDVVVTLRTDRARRA